MAATKGGAKHKMAVTGGRAKWDTFLLMPLGKKEGLNGKWNHTLREAHVLSRPSDPLAENHFSEGQPVKSSAL